MKELSLEKMEKTEASANARCTLFGAAACLLTLDSLHGVAFIPLCYACAST